MELHELRLPDLPRLADRGHVRAITRGPRTLEQVLADASAAMDEQDEAERRAADPLTRLRAEHRRRTLWGRLFGRR